MRIALDAPVPCLFRRKLSRLFCVCFKEVANIEEGVGESSHTYILPQNKNFDLTVFVVLSVLGGFIDTGYKVPNKLFVFFGRHLFTSHFFCLARGNVSQHEPLFIREIVEVISVSAHNVTVR